jgi:hypothetical protein
MTTNTDANETDAIETQIKPHRVVAGASPFKCV